MSVGGQGRLLGALLLAGGAACAAGAPGAPAARPDVGARGADGPPNVVVIVADDLGYGDVGAYGQSVIRTPNLDRMAREGTRFTQFYAGSTVCAPSRSALMTGQHTGRTRVRGNAGADVQTLLPEDTTLAEVLRARGYRTGLVGKWGLGDVGNAGRPDDQGFDHFVGYLNQVHAHNAYPEFLWRNRERVTLRNVVRPAAQRYGGFVGGVATTRVDYAPELLADEAVAFIARERDRPFFLLFAPTLPHANNEATLPDAGAPPELGMETPGFGAYAGRAWPAPEKGFAATVDHLDRSVGRILDQLRASGLAERTVVLFTSDNGPHREGGHDPEFFRSSGPLRGHKRDLYEGGIRVPMIAWAPGRVPAGRVSDHPWTGWDVLPTVAQLAGARAPAAVDGLSMAAALTGRGRAPEHARLYWEFHEQGGKAAIRSGRWKAVRLAVARGGETPVELYDLASDPGERRDVAGCHPGRVARMVAEMVAARRPSAAFPALNGMSAGGVTTAPCPAGAPGARAPDARTD